MTGKAVKTDNCTHCDYDSFRCSSYIKGECETNNPDCDWLTTEGINRWCGMINDKRLDGYCAFRKRHVYIISFFEYKMREAVNGLNSGREDK